MKVIKSEFIVDNLSASVFLNASGKVIKIASESLQDRPSGITFSRWGYVGFEMIQQSEYFWFLFSLV